MHKNEDGISTDLERLTNYDKTILNKTKYRLVKINAGVIRNDINDGLDCIHDPLPENYAHSLITSQSGKITNSKARGMARSAVVVY